MEKEILPVSEGILGKRYTSAQEKSLHYLRQNVVHDFKAKCEIQAQREKDAIWHKIKTTNGQRIREKCENTLQNVLEKNLKNREYKTAGGHQRYKRDVERTKEEYVSVLRDFKQNEILSIWYGFVENMKKIEADIIEADENMSKKDKEAEQRRNQENLEELLKQQQKAQEDALEKQKKDLVDHYEKLDKDRREQQAAQEETFKALAREKMEKEAAQQEVKNYKRSQLEAEKEILRYKKEHDDVCKKLASLKEKKREKECRKISGCVQE